jgi:glyoxylase-like metal-dependent hydrolase (beta-lactamase superfamily II)
MNRTGPPASVREWFEVTPVDEAVTAIREPWHAQDVVCYRVAIGGDVVFIDAGMGFAPLSAALDGIGTARLLLTHCHWDHMGGAGEFAEVRLGDAAFDVDRCRRGWPAEEMRQLTPEFFPRGRPAWLPEQIAIPGVRLAGTFRHGDRFAIGNDTLRVLATPGHTPGSACFLLERRRYLFTGDTLYPGPEYVHTPGADWRAYFRSIIDLAAIADGLAAILPGHNGVRAHPDLLRRHADAVAGRLPPVDVLHDPDGRHVEYVYPAGDVSAGFSLRLPSAFPGFG